jgi:hypothetical protein
MRMWCNRSYVLCTKPPLLSPAFIIFGNSKIFAHHSHLILSHFLLHTPSRNIDTRTVPRLLPPLPTAFGRAHYFNPIRSTSTFLISSSLVCTSTYCRRLNEFYDYFTLISAYSQSVIKSVIKSVVMSIYGSTTTSDWMAGEEPSAVRCCFLVRNKRLSCY